MGEIFPAEKAAADPLPDCQALRRVELPLRDLEFAIESYLLKNGARLDTGTRCFLAQLRDGVEQVAVSVRAIADAPRAGGAPAARPARPGS